MGEMLKKIVLCFLFLLLLGWAFAWNRQNQKNKLAMALDGKVHVSYWEKWTGFEGDAMKAVVDDFNASHDAIHVDLLTVSQINEKTLVATAGGDPPDVAGLFSFDVHVYADLGAVTPLEDLFKESGWTEERYIPAFWKLCVHQGHLWALPTTPATMALHWNKKMFREAGIPEDQPPKTIAELNDYARKLTKKDASGKITQMGFLPTEPGWWPWAWPYFFGGRLWDGEGKITLTDPKTIEAMKWYQSFSKDFGFKTLDVFRQGFGNFSSPQNAFLEGKVAMEIQGVWMYNFINMYNPTLEWAAAPFPVADPAMGEMSAADADVLVIPKGARHPKEAWEFVRYVNEQAPMEKLCMGQRKFSPLREVTPAFLETHPNPYIKTFLRLAYGNAFSEPHLNMWQDFNDTLTVSMERIWLLEVDPAEEMARIEPQLQRKLDRELKRQAVLKGPA